ncbi:reverse transcriptase domain-containing protein [Tanacetum coccineum]
MADNRTMAQLLQAPTEGYEDAIVIPEINANFELKHGLINLVQNKQFFRHDKEDSHAYIHYVNKITSMIRFSDIPSTSIKLMFFPFSLKGSARIWLEKEPPQSILTWDDLVSKFINQFFLLRKRQIFETKSQDFNKDLTNHTFYNALNANDQDSLNFDAGGNFLDRMPRECLKIIESKSKVRNSRNKAVVAKVSSNSSTPRISPDVAALTTEVSELKNMMKTMLIDKQKAQAPVPVKAVEQSCVTCGGAHSYRNCPATDGNVYRDNIQEYVSQAAAANFNQGNTNSRPPMVANQIRPPGFPPIQNNQNRFNQNQGNNFNQNRGTNFNQNRGNNFYQGQVYQPPTSQPPVYQAQPYQASAPQMQGVSKTDFENYVKANDAILRNMQNQGQGLQNQMTNLTEMLSKFVNSNTASSLNSGSLPSNTVTNPKEDLKGITTRSGIAYQGPTIPTSSPRVAERRTEVTKDTVFPTNNGITEDVQPPVVPVENQNPVSEPDVAPVSAPMPNQKPSIPYPSRRNDEKRRENADEQKEKFYEIFKDMSFEISFMDALTLMPKFASTLKALIGNKEKLSEMARTPLNEHCSAVILNKLPEKLSDPGRFLIPCKFPGMDECLALADLGASINLMPFSVWKKLNLPNLTLTCMTLELADHSIS